MSTVSTDRSTVASELSTETMYISPNLVAARRRSQGSQFSRFWPLRRRQMLRKLLVDRMTLEPFEKDGERGYRFSGEGTYARLLDESTATFGGGPNGLPTSLDLGDDITLTLAGTATS